VERERADWPSSAIPANRRYAESDGPDPISLTDSLFCPELSEFARQDWRVKGLVALSDTGEVSRHLWPGAGNDRYDRPVSNLRDAPVGSIGGNLRFGRSHFVSTVLLIGGTSMLRQNARDTWREAEDPVTGASPTGVWAYRSLRGAGTSGPRAAQRRGPDHPGLLSAHASLQDIEQGLYAAARTSEASVPVLEENR